MKGLFTDILLIICLIAVLAAAVLPSVAEPKANAVLQKEEAEFSFDGTFDVIVLGENVSAPGRYTLEYGATYGELFSVAGVQEIPAGFDCNARVRMTDAVLVDGEYVLYLIL